MRKSIHSFGEMGLFREFNRHTAAIFADRVLAHLANHGISPRIIQTDNGTEFVNTSDATDDTPLFI